MIMMMYSTYFHMYMPSLADESDRLPFAPRTTWNLHEVQVSLARQKEDGHPR